MQYRWGVVALGVVAGKEREEETSEKTKENEINRAHKNPQQKIPLWKSIQHIYETPEILRSIFSTDSSLLSDNGVSTSNSPPARNIVMIYPDYYIETCIPKHQTTSEFFFTQIWKTNMFIRLYGNL